MPSDRDNWFNGPSLVDNDPANIEDINDEPEEEEEETDFCDFCQQRVPASQVRGIGPTYTDPASGDSWVEEVLTICEKCDKERQENNNAE